MRKIFILFILVFAVNVPLIYAQYGDYYDGTNSYSYGDMPAPSKSKKSSSGSEKHFIGISPSLYIPTGKTAYIKDFTGVGGGFDIKYKYNFNKIIGLAGGFRYNYAGGSNIQNNTDISTEHNLLDFQVLAVLQYDDVKVTKGFIPYIAAGMDVAVSIVNKTTKVSTYKEDADGAVYLTNTVTAKENESSSNIGFTAAAGLRYAFSNNAVIGFGVDYTYVFTNHDYSGIRVFLDAGYRF
ncbi:MAG TPA: porin family protein [Candidatus Mucispirillum faecigallinarum]|uniref:Porin family protein n=1 Tax=Candidatus Mucispirillum faecigallinarum TaxID=2838699 RepID=A0A9D2GU33_9BACT|nr:porin family protein [Candidatus Mucispirillum faecigallinarum]